MTDDTPLIVHEETPMPQVIKTVETPVNADPELPVSATKFVATLHKTDNEVWTKFILLQHGRENHLVSEWHNILDAYRDQPAQ